MARQKQAIFGFNKGLVSLLGLAREDIKRVSLAAATFVNYITRVLGYMHLRQGWAYLGATYTNAKARYIPFVFSTTDTALIELTDSIMRIWIADVLLNRVSTSTTIVNPNMSLSTGWTQNDDAGATSSFVTVHTINYLQFVGTGLARAIRDQSVTVAGGDANKEHALRIIVARGPISLRVGTSTTDDSYIEETILNTGTHSLAFTPTGNFNIRFFSTATQMVWISQCNIESSGVVTIPTSWTVTDLTNIRVDQSADVVFIACTGQAQKRIERRSKTSWSIANYVVNDGPFLLENVSTTTMTPSVISGNGTLTASIPYFYANHVGALFAVTSTGQTVTANLAAATNASASIVVTNVGSARTFAIIITGTFVGTIDLQSSYDNTTFLLVAGHQWTAPVNTTYTDGLDNQTIYYRLYCSAYTSGTAAVQLHVGTGGIRGICRVTEFTSSTVAQIEVLKPFGSTTAGTTWEEGEWSTLQGFPSCVRLHEGRLWWFGKGGAWGSVSDGYQSYDITILGDSAAINRSIGSGPVDTISWAESTQILMCGTPGSEIAIQSNALGDPITPTSCNLKTVSTQGSAGVDAVKIDQNCLFLQRGGVKVYQATPILNPYAAAQPPTDLTALVPELGLPGIVRMVLQRQPDNRIHCIRSDGTVMLGIFDTVENVLCWSNITTNGLIEDAVVLPGKNGSTEDQLYYVVNRTINGSTVRYLEKWALETECRGGTLNNQMDAFTQYTQFASSTIAHINHLIGSSVVVWDNGNCLTDANGNIATFVVDNTGSITVTNGGVPYLATHGVVGLPYTAQWQSTKLGEAMFGFPALSAKKNMSGLGLICAYIHPKGVMYGNTFDQLYDMPQVEGGTTIDPNAIRSVYDEQPFMLDGGWTTDLRLCLQSSAPRPASIMAAVCDSEVMG